MTLLYIFLGLMGLLIVGNIFTYPLQHHFVFWPKQRAHDHDYHFYVHFEESYLKTVHRGNINLLHFRNLGKKAKGVIIYYHGNADNLARWGQAGEFFQRYGYEVVVYDYRGFGKSTGIMNETNFYSDAEAVYKYVLTHYNPEDIIIYGRSLGAGISSYIAAKFESQQLILETPFSSVKDLFFTYYPFLPPVFIFKYIFPTKKHLKSVKCPVTIIHGTTDMIVPLRCAKKNIPSLKKEDHFVIADGAAHGDVSNHETYRKLMKEIL